MRKLRERRKARRKRREKAKRLSIQEHLLQLARRESDEDRADAITLVANSPAALRVFIDQAEDDDKGRERPLLDFLKKIFARIAEDPEAFFAMILRIIKMIFGLVGDLTSVMTQLRADSSGKEVDHLQNILAA